MSKTLNPIALAETAAAISDTVHSNRDQFRKLYHAIAEHPDIGGFPGIWILCGKCAVEFEKNENPEEDYIDTVTAIGDQILAIADRTGPLPSPEWIVATAKDKVREKQNNKTDS